MSNKDFLIKKYKEEECNKEKVSVSWGNDEWEHMTFETFINNLDNKTNGKGWEDINGYLITKFTRTMAIYF